MGKFQLKDLQGLLLVGHLGLMIVGPALLGLWLGRLLANYLGGYTLLLVITGMLLGLVGGSMQAYKIIMKK